MDEERRELSSPAALHFLPAFFLYLIGSYPAYTQAPPLPLYEQAPDGSYYLYKSTSRNRDLERTYDTVSWLQYDSKVRFSKIKKIKPKELDECCTKPDPLFFMTPRPSDIPAASFPVIGRIDSGRTYHYDSMLVKTNLFEWVNEEFQKPALREEYISGYRWLAAEQSGRKDVFLQFSSNKDGEKEITTLNVSLRKCLHIKDGDLDFFYCTTDTTGNHLRQDIRWYDYPVKWALLYYRNALITVRRDFTATTLDGYGAFYYQPQTLAGKYFHKGIAYFVFRPGYVIYYKDLEWRESSRDPVLYYGECDCPD